MQTIGVSLDWLQAFVNEKATTVLVLTRSGAGRVSKLNCVCFALC